MITAHHWRSSCLFISFLCSLLVFYIYSKSELGIKETLRSSKMGENHEIKQHISEMTRLSYEINPKGDVHDGIWYHPIYLRQSTDLNMTEEELDSFLRSPEIVCKKVFRAGNIGDGGWNVCLSGPYLLKAPCLVYSFGINYDFSFDDSMASNFSCTVKSFDPSMKDVKSHQRSPRVAFFQYGISDKNTKNKLGWELKTIDTILKEQGDNGVIVDYFKMDVEGSEWKIIPDMARKGILENIKQIGFEIHRFTGGTTHVYNLIMILHEYGFRKWRIRFNPRCKYRVRPSGFPTSRCLEMYFINMKFTAGADATYSHVYDVDKYSKAFPDYARENDYSAWP